MKAVFALVLGLASAAAANAYSNNTSELFYRGLPGGSYLQSCRNCGMNGSTLYCSCPDGRGNWYNTSLNINNCRTPVANTYGTLTCD